MHSAVDIMLEKYHCTTLEDYQNALREIIQEIALLGLYRAGFFDHAAFYGGTALRIFYGLRRFSEDLDFSLLTAEPDFTIQDYCKFIKDELGAFGFVVEVTKKLKGSDSNIESAFIKAGTLVHLLKIGAMQPPVSGVSSQDKLKIKLEVDVKPPSGAIYEIKYALNPIPYHVRMFTPSCLFAGKVHAVLHRAWGKDRVKGRDLYDYVWYLSRSTALHIRHLEQRMKQTGHLDKAASLDMDQVCGMLENRFKTINFEQAKKDVLPFIKDPLELATWSLEFFTAITKEKLFAEKNAGIS